MMLSKCIGSIFFLILVCLGGSGDHTIDFEDYEVKPGTVLSVRKDQVQRFHLNQDIEGFLLLFTDDFIASHLSRLEALKTMQLFNELLSHPKVEVTDVEEYKDLATSSDKSKKNIESMMTNFLKGLPAVPCIF